MRNGLVTALAVAGTIMAFESALAQTGSTKAKTEQPRVVYQRNSRFDVKADAGIGFGSTFLGYLGAMGVNMSKDTTTISSIERPSYGIGARAFVGSESKWMVGGFEKYISVNGKSIPIRILVGGALYKPKDPEANLEMQPVGFLETTLNVMNHPINIGLSYHKGRGLNFLAGKRFF